MGLEQAGVSRERITLEAGLRGNLEIDWRGRRSSVFGRQGTEREDRRLIADAR
jgi:hypothetical protein